MIRLRCGERADAVRSGGELVAALVSLCMRGSVMGCWMSDKRDTKSHAVQRVMADGVSASARICVAVAGAQEKSPQGAGKLATPSVASCSHLSGISAVPTPLAVAPGTGLGCAGLRRFNWRRTGAIWRAPCAHILRRGCGGIGARTFDRFGTGANQHLLGLALHRGDRLDANLARRCQSSNSSPERAPSPVCSQMVG